MAHRMEVARRRRCITHRDQRAGQSTGWSRSYGMVWCLRPHKRPNPDQANRGRASRQRQRVRPRSTLLNSFGLHVVRNNVFSFVLWNILLFHRLCGQGESKLTVSVHLFDILLRVNSHNISKGLRFMLLLHPQKLRFSCPQSKKDPLRVFFLGAARENRTPIFSLATRRFTTKLWPHLLLELFKR